jgi:hypothetical protein
VLNAVQHAYAGKHHLRCDVALHMQACMTALFLQVYWQTTALLLQMHRQTTVPDTPGAARRQSTQLVEVTLKSK